MESIVSGDVCFHLKTRKGDIGRYVILPGAPGRVPKIAGKLDGAKLIASNREYTVYTGYLDGEKVSVCSTGIGGPSAAIAVEELVMCGADTFIRVGTSGGIDLKVSGGDLLIASAAIRSEGTSHEYIPDDYPAVANFDVVCALKASADELSTDEDGNRAHVGVVHSKDNFNGEIDPRNTAVPEKLTNAWAGYLKCGCLTSEMEAAAIFTMLLPMSIAVSALSKFSVIFSAFCALLLPEVARFLRRMWFAAEKAVSVAEHTADIAKSRHITTIFILKLLPLLRS